MRRLFIVLLSLLIAGVLPASAQVAQQVPSGPGGAPDSSAVLHITDELTRTPAVQQVLRRFRQLKRQNQLPARRQITRSEVGDTRTFSVYNQTTEGYDEIEFTLRVVKDRFLLWVETAELDNDHVRPQDIDALVQALAEETPPGSINPDEGVIVNDEDVFGTPPDVDGNGKSDVLLLDIRDDYEGPGDGFVAGFVNGADLGSDPGNERDILYLDTKPGIYVPSSDFYRAKDFLAKTAAHEYQHLIHLNYDNEVAFVNEGLSEWAEVVNGYTPRTISYLSDPERYNQWLLDWDRDDPFDDYQRAGLFTNYIAERIGTQETGSITRQQESGVAGYRAVLDQNDIAFEDLLLDFHTANFLNDSGIDTRFGYETPVRQGILAEPTEEYAGWETTETPETQKTVAAGAALYLVWENVEDFNLRLNAASGAADNLRLRILAERSDGSVTVNDYPLQAGIRSFPGSYERLVAVVANVEAGQQASSAGITYSSSWVQDKSFDITPIVYDDGQAVENLFFLDPEGERQDDAVATRFIVPSPDQETRLDKVFLAPYFLSQFSNTTLPPEAPRNLELIIWNSQNGQPGERIYERNVEDARSFEEATRNFLDLTFFEIDLKDEPPLTSLPDTIFVGYTNTGADENALVVSVSEYRPGSPYQDQNMSFVGDLDGGQWERLWDVELSDGTQVGERVLPIRAEFATPQPAGPPPVRLVEGSFTAEPNDDSVVLSWRTSEEREGSFFEVQRSLDGGSTFMPIDTLQSQGTGSGEQYTYEDSNIPFGVDTLHYRLKLAGQSGSFGYSETLQVVLPSPQQVILHGNFPNPFRQETTIRYELTRRQHVTLAVFDMLGRKVAVLADEVQEGDVETTFQAEGLSSGVYVYVLETEDRMVTHRMILLQ